METVLRIYILISLNSFISDMLALNREKGIYIGMSLKAWRKTVAKKSEGFNKFSSWLNDSSFWVKKKEKKRQTDKEVQMRT